MRVRAIDQRARPANQHRRRQRNRLLRPSRTTTKFRFERGIGILPMGHGLEAHATIFGMNATEACIALNMLPTVGPVRLRKLLQVFEQPERILTAKGSELRKVEGIGREVADQISNWESIVDLATELNRVREFGATVITQDSPSYPKPLREIHAPPIVLYVWGELQDRDHHAIGIIGARRTTHYGTEAAKKLSYQLAYAGLTVISGLARGIDTSAHQGALAAKGRTIAVIGSGLLKLYPPENRGLAEKIRDGNGAIVSEFSMEIEPDRQTFPMRNRIISGWSHGILVVEAGLNSGALITASQALEQGRSVYAVPGHINAPSAMGSNRLIQQGAKLVMDAGDILDDLQVLLPETKPAPEAAVRPLPPLTEDERRVYDAIEATETPIDQIAAKSDLPSATVSSTLLRLELKRLVKQLPGKYFVKLA
jgi:DNA processing protein